MIGAGMSLWWGPGKNLRYICASKMPFPAFWDHSQWKKVKYSPKTGGFWSKHKTGWLESPQFILRTILVMTFHKLYHQHSERLSLRSSRSKHHRHLGIKAFALNPCPKFTDVLIWITIRQISQMPVNSCVPSHVPKYTQKSLWKWSSPSWIRTNPLLKLHIPQDKSEKTHESPTYWGPKELPMWW